MSTSFLRYACGRYLYVTDSADRRAFPLAAGKYRFSFDGVATSFAITANDRVVQRYSQDDATPAMFSPADDVTLDTDGFIRLVAGADVTGLVEVRPL